MLAISENYLNSLCELKTLENRVLCAGYINEINDEGVEIKFREDTKILIPANTLIKVSVYNEKLGFKVLIGKVYVGTDEFVRLVEVVSIIDFEKREFFRINIFENVTLYKHSIQADEIEMTSQPSITVLINNISLCGVCFNSVEKFDIGDKVYILLDLPKTPTVFCCIIQRCFYDDGVYGYGCEFTEHKQQQIDDLYKFIYIKQVEFLKRAKEQNMT